MLFLLTFSCNGVSKIPEFYCSLSIGTLSLIKLVILWNISYCMWFDVSTRGNDFDVKWIYIMIRALDRQAIKILYWSGVLRHELTIYAVKLTQTHIILTYCFCKLPWALPWGFLCVKLYELVHLAVPKSSQPEFDETFFHFVAFWFQFWTRWKAPYFLTKSAIGETNPCVQAFVYKIHETYEVRYFSY